MGLFGKSLEEKVNDALEKIRGQFPGSNISATVNDKTVTLQGQVPDLATKSAIMAAFNSMVETDNTLNQLTAPQAVPSPVSGTSFTQPTSSSFGSAPSGVAGARMHDVVSGDTLSGIAKKYYGNANDYMKIFNANKNILDDPDKIKVGQKLTIPQ